MSKKSPTLESNYSLLDSGEGEKLEQFGSKLLIRPSTLCVWKKRQPHTLWQGADACFEHKKGWKYLKPRFESWDIEVCGVRLKLRLQDNGQIGFFPEHTGYLAELKTCITEVQKTTDNKPRVLNLFAYTGLATIKCLQAGAHVTHVDLSKRALDWAQQNVELNSVDAQSLRFIREDAISFIRKEVKRDKQYDLIIADPPSFSRITDKETWDLDAVLPELLQLLTNLLAKNKSSLFFTCHAADWGSTLVENLLSDIYQPQVDLKIESRALSVSEQKTPRRLAAGFLTKLMLD